MILLALALSVLVGLSLGMLGGGGSILTVPILLYVLGMEEKLAIATSLLVVSATSVVAAATHAREGNVEARVGLAFGLTGAAGAFVGGLGSEAVPGAWLIRGFLLMMFGTAVAMIRGRGEVRPAPFSLPKVIATGFSLGLLTGLVGAGGGFVVVPALVLVGGLPMKRAVGTSLVVIAVQTLAGFVGHATHVRVDLGLAAGISVAAAAGAVAGGRLTRRVPAETLRKAFGWFVLAMALYMALHQLWTIRT